MRPPEGTSIIDVADPRRPRIVSQVSLPAHTHSHKVRVHGDIMLVNNELFRATTGERPDDFEGGIKIYDIATGPGRARSGITNRWVRTVSIRMAPMPTSRPRKTALSATSS